VTRKGEGHRHGRRYHRRGAKLPSGVTRATLVPMRSMCSKFPVLATWLLSACAGQRVTAQQWELARTAEPTGARVYDAQCASCHGSLGDGARGVPELVGPGALPIRRNKRQEDATFQTAQDVFEYTSTKMPLPPKRAGSLRESDYWIVVSFLIRAKGASLPPGGLAPHNARSIRIN
jgi:mono/diheme cytochrome c family protein